MLDPSVLLEHIDGVDGSKEKECQPFLEAVKGFLCRETAKTILVTGREQPNRHGYNDFTVSAIVSDGGTRENRVAYVWEVKAPQCYAFEADDHKSRLRPTKDLVKAENQLFHYVEEFRNSTSFRTYFNLDNTSDVVPAGIIIGRSSSPIKPSSLLDEKSNIDGLLKYSMYIRKKYFYQSHNLVLKNWNWVYDLLVQKPQIMPLTTSI